jgi:hypothetical protein
MAFPIDCALEQIAPRLRSTSESTTRLRRKSYRVGFNARTRWERSGFSSIGNVIDERNTDRLIGAPQHAAFVSDA